MKTKVFKIIFITLLCLSSKQIFSQIIYVNNGSIITVQVDKTYGATIELPSAVHIVTPPKYLKVEPLSDPVTNSGQDVLQNQMTTNDVKIFQVFPSNQKHIMDKMTFLLWNGKTITVQFVVSEQNSDNFYQLKFTGTNEKSKSRFASNSKYFLSDEKELMIKMLKDDGGTDRKIVDAKVKIEKYPDLSVKLVRIFQQDSLTGYVFTFTNSGSESITLNPTVLTMGEPNRIVMIQTDHEELNSCGKNNDPNPRGTGCMTAIRIVTRDSKNLGQPLDLGIPAKLPFVTSPDLKPNRGQM